MWLGIGITIIAILLVLILIMLYVVYDVLDDIRANQIAEFVMKNIAKEANNLDVVQQVEHYIWDVGVASSSLTTQTKNTKV